MSNENTTVWQSMVELEERTVSGQKELVSEYTRFGGKQVGEVLNLVTSNVGGDSRMEELFSHQ